MRGGNPTCRCKAAPPARHGPDDLWTRTVAGKTVTVRLPAEQAAPCQPWIRNMRRLDRLVKALQDLGLRAARARARAACPPSPRAAPPNGASPLADRTSRAHRFLLRL